MTTVKWAVIGTSGFALDCIAQAVTLGRNSKLTAIVSRSRDRARAAAERLGAPNYYTSIDEIEADAVDGVFIVTPNPVHAPLAIAAAQRGLHVIVEKPMAPTTGECQAMIDAARATGVVLSVAHCTEWSPPVVRARELVTKGAIGKVIQATIGASFNSPSGGYWRQTDSTEEGGGPLYDMGIHAIDALQAIVGPIEQVAGFLDHHIHDYAAEDTTSTLLRFASGAHGVVQAHFNCRQNNFEIIGTEGRLRSNNWLGRDFTGDLQLVQDDQIIDQPLMQENVYVAQIEHVSNCVLNKTAPVISGERGLSNVLVAQSAVESARQGQAVQLLNSKKPTGRE